MRIRKRERIFPGIQNEVRLRTSSLAERGYSLRSGSRFGQAKLFDQDVPQFRVRDEVDYTTTRTIF
jgi:hypothetical protein